MNKNKNTLPVRTCIICRKKVAKDMLHRYVWQFKEATAVLDRQQRMSGRGVYCCKEGKCVEKFSSPKQVWKRAFRLN
ncbi:YlxR family protein [Desulfocapsa sulfexigens]|uniref:YlxR family protein n=1 Tax=Desulfocapsa sulfexigens TaxID=65555 RepID=UPI0005A515F1